MEELLDLIFLLQRREVDSVETVEEEVVDSEVAVEADSVEIEVEEVEEEEEVASTVMLLTLTEVTLLDSKDKDKCYENLHYYHNNNKPITFCEDFLIKMYYKS